MSAWHEKHKVQGDYSNHYYYTDGRAVISYAQTHGRDLVFEETMQFDSADEAAAVFLRM